MSPRITVVGGGNMGGALVAGLLRAGWSAESVEVVERSAERRVSLAASHPGLRVAEQIGQCEAAIVAVKPADATAIAGELAAHGARRVLSIAAGVSAATLQEAAGHRCAVVRAMPNTPALVGAGITAICGSPLAGTDDLDWAESVLAAVGVVVRVDERDMDAVTAISGSGPAYLFLVAEALVAAGVAEGLSREVCDGLVRQLFVGAGAMLAARPDDPATLRAEVTSPQGVTAAAIEVLESADLRGAVRAAVGAAVRRSRELGR
jgi:pyrroline-5-carboxylate reductase